MEHLHAQTPTHTRARATATRESFDCVYIRGRAENLGCLLPWQVIGAAGPVVCFLD